MSVSIKKTGIVQASGEIGANILLSTSNLESTYTYPSSSYSNKISKTTAIIPSATNYVLSFWAKSTVNGDGIRFHFYNPNTTTYAITNQGTINNGSAESGQGISAGDGGIDFFLSTDWAFYWCKYTQSATTAKKSFLLRMAAPSTSYRCSGTGTVSIKELKMEEGTVPTLWIPNEADADYFSSICGFNEFDTTHASISRGYINSIDFIEI